MTLDARLATAALDGGAGECPVCGGSLADGAPVLYCAQCATPHHHDCWRFAGGCAVFACGSRRAVERAALAGEGAGVPDVARRVRPFKVSRRRRAWFSGLSGERLDRSESYMRLDLTTRLEAGLELAAIVVPALAFYVDIFSHVEPTWSALRAAVPVAAGLLLLRMFVDCTYVLDNDKQLVLYQRSVAGLLNRTWQVCSFREVRRVGLVGEQHSYKGSTWWVYEVVLELPDGARLRVSNGTRRIAQATGLGRSLAKHFGVPFAAGAPGTPCLGKASDQLPEGTGMATRLAPPVWGNAGAGWKVLLAALVWATIAILAR